MTLRIVLASRNQSKAMELRRILDSAGLAVEVLGSESFADLPDIAETGANFIENALIKAAAVARHTGLPAVADDSGLCVDELNAMPGILSARWAGRDASDENNLRLVLDQMSDVPDGRRGAQFRCAAALAIPDLLGSVSDARAVEGEVAGILRREPVGEYGFGYDPIFQPDGFEVTTAQMSPEQKDSISHRGKALRSLSEVLSEVLGIGSRSAPLG